MSEKIIKLESQDHLNSYLNNLVIAINSTLDTDLVDKDSAVYLRAFEIFFESLRLSNYIIQGLEKSEAERDLMISYKGSGMPTIKEYNEVCFDIVAIHQNQRKIIPISEIKKDIIEKTISRKKVDKALLKKLSMAMYNENLLSMVERITPPPSIQILNRIDGKNLHLCKANWAIYDSAHHCPVIYSMTFEMSAEKDDIEETTSKLIKTLENSSMLDSKLFVVASTIDSQNSLIHPKHLERTIFGPFFQKGITDNGRPLSYNFGGSDDDNDIWFLNITQEKIRSKEQVVSKSGFFGMRTGAKKEVFDIEIDMQSDNYYASDVDKTSIFSYEAFQELRSKTSGAFNNQVYIVKDNITVCI